MTPRMVRSLIWDEEPVRPEPNLREPVRREIDRGESMGDPSQQLAERPDLFTADTLVCKNPMSEPRRAKPHGSGLQQLRDLLREEIGESDEQRAATPSAPAPAVQPSQIEVCAGPVNQLQSPCLLPSVVELIDEANALNSQGRRLGWILGAGVTLGVVLAMALLIGSKPSPPSKKVVLIERTKATAARPTPQPELATKKTSTTKTPKTVRVERKMASARRSKTRVAREHRKLKRKRWPRKRWRRAAKARRGRRAINLRRSGGRRLAFVTGRMASKRRLEAKLLSNPYP